MMFSKAAWYLLLLLLTLVYAQQSPCDLLKMQAVSARNIAANSTVVGRTDVGEVVTYYGGDVIGDLYIMNAATVVFAPNMSAANNSVIQITGNVYLFDNATFYVSAGTQVSIFQTAPSQHFFYVFDNASLGFAQATVDHGVSANLIHTWFVCHQSHASITQTDYSQRTKGSVAAFVYDSGSLAISQLLGNLIEVTLSNSAHLTAVNNSVDFTCATYFTIDEPLLVPLTNFLVDTRSDFVQTIQSKNSNRINISIAITATTTSFGLWVWPGANIVLNNSQVYLFPSWGQTSTFNTPVTGLMPCSYAQISGGNTCDGYEDRTFTLSAGYAALTIHFLNSQVMLWNAYFEGGGASTTHKITDSTLGESNCREQAVCSYNDVTIDGKGGFCTIENNAVATHTLGAIVTYTYVRNGATAIFDQTVFTWDSQKPDIRLEVETNSTVKMINSVFSTSESIMGSSGAVYGLVVDESSLFLRAAILPLPVVLTQSSQCESILLPQVEMEVKPLSAPRAYKVEVLDETQVSLITLTVSSPPSFFSGAWGTDNSTLYTPHTSGTYIVQVTTASGNASAVARSFVNVSGCKTGGCPYAAIQDVFEFCQYPDFEDTLGECALQQCRVAAFALAQSWGSLSAAAKKICVSNYPLTVGAISLPFGLNISLAATRLSRGALCSPLVSGAGQSSSVALLLTFLLSVLLL